MLTHTQHWEGWGERVWFGGHPNAFNGSLSHKPARPRRKENAPLARAGAARRQRCRLASDLWAGFSIQRASNRSAMRLLWDPAALCQ